MVRTPEGCIVDVCTKFETKFAFVQKLLGGSQNFEFGSRDPKPRPLRGHLMVRTQ